MNEIPHDRRALIYLNSLEESINESDSHEIENIALGHKEMLNYLNEIEEKPRAPKSTNEKLAALGMELSHALIDGEDEKAEVIKNQYIQLAESHAEASLLGKVPSRISEHSVPNYCYRNWKGTPEGINFGVIEAELKDDATIGIIGDWGTGDNDAKQLLQELKNHSPDIIIHLGDIYNTCRYKEDVLPKFIDIFNDVYPLSAGIPTRPPILTIPGNHDYMSKGGKGFFKLIDTVNAHHPKWEQKASYFCLRTKSNKWQILGADTGINDPSYSHKNPHPGLEPDEYTWHFNKMKNFKSKGQGRTIFMTHHPLLSATHSLQDGKYINKDLADNFKGYLTSGKVQADEIKLWMWGHNHWFIPYVKTASVDSSTLDKGRLIGGSARHDYHTSSEIVKSGKHVIEHVNKSGKSVPLVPDMANNLPNHTYAVIKLSDADAEVTHYQTPSWHEWDKRATKTLPSTQHNVLLREYILDTKPSQKYPAH